MKRGEYLKVRSSIVSDHETVESTGLGVLVTHHAVSVLCDSGPLGLEESLQILEKLHLTSEVLGVVLDVSLVSSQVLHDVFLLTQLGIEEFIVTLEFSRQSLVGVAHVLGLVGDTTLE